MDSLLMLVPSWIDSSSFVAVGGLVFTTVVITVTRAMVYRVLRRG